MTRHERIVPTETATDLQAEQIALAVQIGQMFDICVEAAREAREAFPSLGKDKNGDNLPDPRFDAAYRFARAQKMHRAGLPMSLLGKYAENTNG